MDIPNLPQEYKTKFDSFPEPIKKFHQKFRSLCFEVANELGCELTESVKWGQLSISAKGGTPIRIDWQESLGNTFSVFCHCQTKLIDTFRQLYPTLSFVKTREWQIPLNEQIPTDVASQLLETAFRYQKLKDEPLLGQSPRT